MMAGTRSELDEVVRRFREHPGRLAKASLELVTEVLGSTDWVRGPGDDAAVIPRDEGSLLVAGEAIWPPFVDTDPFAAGIAAVVANVNDIAAMGGRPLALVDTVVGPEAVARRALEGMRSASERYGVPIVGGHLTVRDGPPALSAFVLGEASALLSSVNAKPAQALLFACALEGSMREGFGFFSSFRERADRLRDDLEVLPRLAETGACLAAMDVSMAGLLGSLAMLLEPTRTGVVMDLERLPRPPDVELAGWTAAFLSYGFLLCAPAGRADDCVAAFEAEGLACAEIGVLDDTGRVQVALGDERSELLDLTRDGVTKLSGEGPRTAPRQSST